MSESDAEEACPLCSLEKTLANWQHSRISLWMAGYVHGAMDVGSDGCAIPAEQLCKAHVEILTGWISNYLNKCAEPAESPEEAAEIVKRAAGACNVFGLEVAAVVPIQPKEKVH